MTDNEIKKALECCKDCSDMEECNECPYVECHTKKGCMGELMDDALDLINRQQAEVEKQSQNFKVLVSDHRVLQQSFDNLKGLYEEEKLRAEKLKEKCIYFIKELQEAEAEIGRVTALAAEWKDAAYTYADSIDRVKAEEIKEFAERLKRRFYACSDVNIYAANVHIDNLVKEMVGEKKW